jgi:BirA family biotin operon repressor/biotin-[acetyl-CoA-carboxylase] ligase
MTELSRAMAARLAQWDRGAGFAAIRGEWLSHATGIGGDIHVRLSDREVTGTFETLDSSGRLMLRLPCGAVEAIAAGEIFAPARAHA